ncbi:hypothetical protein GCM10010277_68840 [Streptomyces longisporoflavus]|nr:hypothetical protein GCM10010277_68840 [Streptomyces longisporoflavus]
MTLYRQRPRVDMVGPDVAVTAASKLFAVMSTQIAVAMRGLDTDAGELAPLWDKHLHLVDSKQIAETHFIAVIGEALGVPSH